jgi:carboxylesterase
MPQTISTAEPFLFPGDRTGILLTHGFTGAPKEMRWMGEYLHGRGYTVLGIRLAGHATRPEDMIRSRWQDWLLSVEDGYNLLRSCTDRIFLAGLSMGGILSLTFAGQMASQEAGQPLRGVIAMSTPYALPDDPRLKYVKLLSKLQPYLPKNDAEPGSGWFGDAWRQHVSYPQNPVRAIGELVQLVGAMQQVLPQVTAPVLLVHSRDDDYVIMDSMPRIYEQLGSRDKQILWIEGSGHVITEEPQREVVFRAAAEFIARLGQNPDGRTRPARARQAEGSA